MAASTHGPVSAATSSDTPLQMIAMARPQRPAMRPEGIGRCGSLMASTWRSNQSFTAWLVPHTSGPASAMPAIRKDQREATGTPDDSTPHTIAHIGGNQVIGLSRVTTSRSAGSGAIAGKAAERAMAEDYAHGAPCVKLN